MVNSVTPWRRVLLEKLPVAQLIKKFSSLWNQNNHCCVHRGQSLIRIVKVKVKFTLEQATKAQRGSRGIALLLLQLRRWMRLVVNATPSPLYPQERPSTQCIGGWVGPTADLDGRGKCRPHRDSIPGPLSPQRVAIVNQINPFYNIPPYFLRYF